MKRLCRYASPVQAGAAQGSFLHEADGCSQLSRPYRRGIAGWTAPENNEIVFLRQNDLLW